MFLQKYIKKVKKTKEEFEELKKEFELKKREATISFSNWESYEKDLSYRRTFQLEKDQQSLKVEIAKLEATLAEKKIESNYELATARLEVSKTQTALKLEETKNIAIIANYNLLISKAAEEATRLTSIAMEAVKATTVPKIDIKTAA